ncbi:hypothetical protein QR685DRAFT_552324 [Neurospora intermedia]|uniref:Uncharacterized protein n=1 Tax=Neurospora intermedia TaxID=5142 RepID=A0ABR3DJ26_NEUIN
MRKDGARWTQASVFIGIYGFAECAQTPSYNSDVSLDFIGRKNGLIKLRGQRIELSEVKYHVRNSQRDLSQVEATYCGGNLHAC